MIRPIMKDVVFLSKKSTEATENDIPVALDLLQTLGEHKKECVGMAANMIGVSKRIIVFTDQNDGFNKILIKTDEKTHGFNHEDDSLHIID